MQIDLLGWNSTYSAIFEPYHQQGMVPLRIIRGDRGSFTASGEAGEIICEVTGTFRNSSLEHHMFPAVGDWVAAVLEDDRKHGRIHAVLPRRSAFSRKVAGRTTEEQVLAANIDILFVVTGLDDNFNLRRIERYTAQAWESGAEPIIVLNKADLCNESLQRLKEVESIVSSAPVHLVSALQGTGLEPLGSYVTRGRTAAIIGSSGVGKSTIINALMGNSLIRVGEVSSLGSRGRHTTTRRELHLLPGGGMLIDTPGLREIQVWGDDEVLGKTFEEIEALSQECRFRDCSHTREPGCAVTAALDSGTLEHSRYESYRKLKREYDFLEKRQAERERIDRNSRNKRKGRF